MDATSHLAPLPRKSSPQPPKRPRVSFATVSKGSPYEHILSSLLGSARPDEAAASPSSGRAAALASIRGDCRSDTSGEEFTGELTANLLSLSTLVEEDEKYVGSSSLTAQKTEHLAVLQASWELVQETVTAQAFEKDQHDAVQPSATETQSPYLPDLYEDFKKSKSKDTFEAFDAKLGQTSATDKAALLSIVQSPRPASASRSRSADTVSIDALVRKIEDIPAAAQRIEIEGEVPEGRKSFGFSVSQQDIVPLQFGSLQACSMEGLSNIPTPLQLKRQGPYTSGARMQCPTLSSCPPRGAGTGTGTAAAPRSPQAAKQPNGSNNVMDFHRSCAQSLQAEHRPVVYDPQSSPLPSSEGHVPAASFQKVHRPLVAASQSPPLLRRGQQSHAAPSQEGRQSPIWTSSSGRELDSLLYSPTESALPASSAFHVMPETALSQEDQLPNTAGNAMIWEDFLNHIGVVTFSSLDAHQSEGSIDAERIPAAVPSAAQVCPHAQQVGGVFEQQRVQLLLQTVKTLASCIENTRMHYIASVSRWNESATTAPAAAEVAKILDSPQELQTLRSKSKVWQAYCKRAAWLRWSSMKHEWLLKDLACGRAANSAMKSQLASKGQVSLRLNDACKKAKRMVKHQQARQELQSNADRHRQVTGERMHSVEEEQQLMLRKTRDAREELEAEMSIIENLERCAEEARQLAQQSQLEFRQAKRSLLWSKARRVSLQQQHSARTCTVTRCSASRLELSLRGGVTACVTMASPNSNLVCIGVCPCSKTGNSLFAQFTELRHDLVVLAWKGILAGLPGDECCVGQDSGASPQVTLPSQHVEKVIRCLDCAALRVDDQLSSLQSVRSCPELANVSANLIMGECALIKASFDIVVPRSHKIVPGPGGLAYVSAMGGATRVEVTKCVIEVSSERHDFPDSVDWSSASVHQVFGPGRYAEAVQQTLHELCGASILEALSAAAQAIQQAWR
eukprot:TRINITY_DN8759_c0_g1_i1.p1 TRINITY_DN8759_c0_g1~~TRINITY_DN8759_c0_g1_i1.p1  ORF type:complete len:964 (-),score=181.34 TRINITY_DN8759_c0_g1_i1:316-3207(-)